MSRKHSGTQTTQTALWALTGNNPDLVWPSDIEVPFNQVGHGDGRLRGAVSARSITVECLDLVRTHDARDAVLAAGFACLSKIQEYSGRSIDAMACAVRSANQPQQPCILNGSVGERLALPSVVSSACHIQEPAHSLDIAFVAVRLYEPVNSTDIPRSRSTGHWLPHWLGQIAELACPRNPGNSSFWKRRIES